jgi:hypothetical protein
MYSAPVRGSGLLTVGQMVTRGILHSLNTFHNVWILVSHSCDSGQTASVVWWSEFLAANPEVPGAILSATRFSE